jgi:predicted Rossmann fold flavoprotein
MNLKEKKEYPQTRETKLTGDRTLVVIGGGAAGFFCAVNAARLKPGLKVLIVEKTNKLLSKVKISGGGRCNVTHHCFDIPELIKRYPRGQNFLKKAFHHFGTRETVEWFEARGVNLKSEADGRMFPVTNSSQTIIDCLIEEAHKYSIEILLNHEVKKIEVPDKEFENFDEEETGPKQLKIIFSDSSFIDTDFICVACGGYPKSSQFEWLLSLGHTIENPVPSLFTFNIPNDPITRLMGVSVEHVTVKIVGSKLIEKGPVLITHWGLSGPAILKLSAWGARELNEKQYHFSIQINWLKNHNEQTLRDEWVSLRNKYASRKMDNENPFDLPNRLWTYLLTQSGIDPGLRWGDLSSVLQNRLIRNLTGQILEVKGKTTYKEEFVTSGGINLPEIDVNTLESKKIPNLFFAGEIINVDGITGGFNFQHAWTSGFIAAKAIGNK